MIWHLKHESSPGAEHWMIYPCPNPRFTWDKQQARPFGSREEVVAEIVRLKFLYPATKGKLSVETDKD